MTTLSHLFLFDSRVTGWQQLLDQLPPGSRWVEIHPGRDGLSQIEAALKGVEGLASLQIVSHGAPGTLSLGDSSINAEALNADAARWAAIGNALSETGDLLLYGCEVGAGETGQTFIDTLSRLTGADVAANSDLTGLGGDWELDAVAAGSGIEAAALQGGDELGTLANPTGSITLSVVGGGSIAEGATLQVTNTLQDADGIVDLNGDTYADVALQWYADSDTTPIAGERLSTLKLTQALVGKAIYVKATYIDLLGNSHTVTSGSTAAVVNVSNAPTGSVSIDGTAAQGQTLTASNTLADADGLGTVSYQWKADGANIVGATGSTLALGQAQVGKAITVTASYTDNEGTKHSVTSAASAAVTNVNDAPSGTVDISGQNTLGATLTASNTLADIDGLGAISYQWKAASVAISGATSSTLVLGAAQVGKTITVTASYTDSQGTAESRTSDSTGAVTLSNTRPSGTVAIAVNNGHTTSTLAEGDTLTASNTLADADGIGIVSYQWFADDVAIAGARFATLLLNQSHVGKAITVQARYTDQLGTFETVLSSSTAAVGNVSNGTTGSVTIDGTAAQGQTLTASNTLADADGLGTISYQWRAADDATGTNIRDIVGATGSSFTLTQTQVGKFITVVARQTDGEGSTSSTSSTATSAVANVNDAPSGKPAITGLNTQGATLTASNTLTDADGIPTSGAGAISYQWKADGADISGATGATLLLGPSLVGKTITVTAAYTDGGNTTERITSDPTGAVTARNSAPTGSVTISDTTPTEGDTLTVSHNLSDADGPTSISASYQWYADEVPIDGARFSALLLNQSHVGKAMTVRARYTDALGTTESVLSASTEPVADIDHDVEGEVSVTGAMTQGSRLTASNTLRDPDGMGTVRYQWQTVSASGVITDIPNGTNSSLLLTQSLVGKTLMVSARYTDGQGTVVAVPSALTPPIENINDPPSGRVLISGNLRDGQTLTATHTLADADGLGGIRYAWFADDEPIVGARGATLRLNQGLVNQWIRVEASYTDEWGTPETVSSASTSVVEDVNVSPTGRVSISGGAKQGVVLTATNDLDDGDGMGPVSYQWLADGVEIPGANSVLLTLTQSQVGKSISVRASYTDQQGFVETPVPSAAIGPVINVNDAPSGSISIAGTLRQGQTLSVNTTSLADADGLGTLSYQWRAGNVNIPGATESTLQLTQAQVAKSISVAVSYQDRFGTAETVTSGPSANVVNINDSASGSIQITGVPEIGRTVGVNPKIVDPDGVGTLLYQWRVDGVNRLGAINSTLNLTQDMAGKAISVAVSYVDIYGGFERLISEPVTAQTLVEEEAQGVFGVTGSLLSGATATASLVNVTDPDGPTSIAYRWQRLADGQWTDLAGSSAATLTAPSDGSWNDRLVRAVATTTDSQGGQTDFYSDTWVVGQSPQAGAPAALGVTGVAYHWRSHQLISDVELDWISLPRSSISAGGGRSLALRDARLDEAQGQLVVEVWAESNSAASSFDFSARSEQALSVEFVPALPSSWVSLATALSTKSVDFGAYQIDSQSLLPGSGVTGAVKLGELRVALDPAAAGGSVTFEGISIGGSVLQSVEMAYRKGIETDQNLRFDIRVPSPGLQALQAGRDADGQASDQNAITSADAFAALQIAVGRVPGAVSGTSAPTRVSPYQIIAADVDRDGSVTASDALEILRMAVRSPRALGNGWLFVEDTRDLWNETSQSYELSRQRADWDRHIVVDLPSERVTNLVGVLQGDVDGSWQSTPGAPRMTDSLPQYFQNLASQLGAPLDQWGVYPG